MNQFSISEAIGFGWNKTKSNFGFLAGVYVLAFVIQIAFVFPAEYLLRKVPWLGFVLRILAWFVQMLVSLGLMKILLKLCDGETPEVSDLWQHYPRLWKFVLGSLAFGLVIGVSILLLLPFLLPASVIQNHAIKTVLTIAGFVIAFGTLMWSSLRFHFYSFMIADKGVSPIESLNQSARITKGSVLNLLLFYICLGLINLAGAICLLIGLLVTVPLTGMAGAFVYRKLEGTNPKAGELPTASLNP